MDLQDILDSMLESHQTLMMSHKEQVRNLRELKKESEHTQKIEELEKIEIEAAKESEQLVEILEEMINK